MLACVYFNNVSLTDEAVVSLLTQLENFSPSIELLPSPHGSLLVLLDLGILPSAKARTIAAKLISMLKTFGYEARLGLAKGRFVATIAAQTAESYECQLISQQEQARFLASQPIHFLSIPAVIKQRLDLLAIHTLGDLSKLPESALVDQFGAVGVQMAALARGQDSQIVNGAPLIERLASQTSFDSAIAGGEELFQEMKHQLTQLFAQLKERGQLATRLRVTFHLEGGGIPLQITLRFATPHREAIRVLNALRHRLTGETVVLQRALSGLDLSLEGLVEEQARQLMLPLLNAKQRRSAGIERVLERLRQSEEPSSLMQVIWDEPLAPIPERRAHLQDHVLPTRTRGLYVPKELHVAMDDRGLPRLVRMRSGWVPVEWVIGSWLVEDGWWTASPLKRSYYRLMLQNGAIICLFRDQSVGRWYQQAR